MRRTLIRALAALAPIGLGTAQDLQPLLGEPVPGLTPAQLQLFHEGRVAFSAPLSEAEGLGPIFNDPSCGACHGVPATGGSGTREVTRFGKAGTPFDPLDGLGGSLLQDQSLDLACREFIPAEADVVANRVTPICFGAGLLEAIPQQEFLDNEANQPPYLSGFISWVGDLADPSAPHQPARFGWKGGIHNVITFSIDAGLNEMGLTSVFLPNENAPNGDQALLAACDTVADPEDAPDAAGFTRIDRFTHFQRFLAAPPQVPPQGSMAGEAIFDAIGCAECHRSTYTTRAAPEAALSGQVIRPYSDFLLHDMGAEADQIAEGNASETHMQTRALWGLRHRVSFMHDGDVTGLPFDMLMDACIQRHAGEGATARAAYNALGALDQASLHAFLASLGQAHFDYEDSGGALHVADNDRDEFDWFFIEPFFTGEAPGSFTPNDSAAVADIQQDGDFDLREFAAFQAGFTGDLIGSDPPTPKGPGDPVRLSVRAGGNRIIVAPGGLVRYDVTCEALGTDNQGVATATFDLHLSSDSSTGGFLPPADVPTHGPMTNFVSPVGLSNPQGFGGVAQGGNVLLQVGGAMNTINNSFAPQPLGGVTTGLGVKGSPVVLVEGALTAPTTPGVYFLRLVDPAVSLLTSSTSGFPFWEVQEAPTGQLRNLTITVVAGGPEIYCAGKPSSEGCSPEIYWFGTPSLTGPDNFQVRAKSAVAGEPGLAVLGLTSQSLPFQGGTLCVGDFIGRGNTVNASGSDPCSGLYAWKFRQSDMAHLGLNAGDVVHTQWYFRDTAQTDGTMVGLSDALRFTVQP